MDEKEPKEPKFEFRALPPLSDLEDAEAKKEIVECLEELDKLVIEKAKVLGREDQLKDRLGELQKQTGQKGFRFGLLCYTAQDVAGRKTLDKLLLMENGCPASVINQSYKTGKPSVRQTFIHLKEEEG